MKNRIGKDKVRQLADRQPADSGIDGCVLEEVSLFDDTTVPAPGMLTPGMLIPAVPAAPDIYEIDSEPRPFDCQTDYCSQ